MYTIKCPNCGSENKNTNIRCEVCNSKLVRPESITTSKRGELTFKEKSFMLVFLIGFIYVLGLGFQLSLIGLIIANYGYNTEGIIALIFGIYVICVSMCVIVCIISAYKTSKKEQK